MLLKILKHWALFSLATKRVIMGNWPLHIIWILVTFETRWVLTQISFSWSFYYYPLVNPHNFNLCSVEYIYIYILKWFLDHVNMSLICSTIIYYGALTFSDKFTEICYDVIRNYFRMWLLLSSWDLYYSIEFSVLFDSDTSNLQIRNHFHFTSVISRYRNSRSILISIYGHNPQYITFSREE